MAFSQPPPERLKAVQERSWIIYSFWVVVIFLGLPMWWQTTSIERAALPLDEMLNWSNQPDTRPIYTVPIHIAAPDIPCETLSRTLRETESLFNQKTGSWGFEVSIEPVWFSESLIKDRKANKCAFREASPGSHAATLDIELRPGTSFNLDTSSGTVPAIATYASNAIDTLAPALAESLQEVLADEQMAVSYQYHDHGRSDPDLIAFTDKISAETKSKIHDNDARSFKSSPTYHLTFSLFTAGGNPSSWDIHTALNQHIQPIVHALSQSTNISITTQIQLYSRYSPSIYPYHEENKQGSYLRKSDLTAFVNTAEWPLSPSIGLGPTINFVLYIPSKKETPLYVEGNENHKSIGGAWIVPQWGGIAILNAPIVQNDPTVSREDVKAHLTPELLQPAFEVFQAQLLALLGVPSPSLMSLPLRLKSFQRLSALSLHLRTSSNLGSLARLAQHLNSIPIPRHVSDLVDSAMSSLKAYRGDRTEESGISAANQGFKASERAFFDKSMVGQVYFPDEHKVAVYLPLLGPIGVPLAFGLLREVKALAARFRS